MNEEQRIAYLNSQIACALIEMNGMVAENQWRASNGNSPCYGEEQFQKLIDKYGLGHNDVMTSLTGR